MVFGPDPLEDTLKRPITTISLSITTKHYNDRLPSPLSCTHANANDDPPSPLPPLNVCSEIWGNVVYFKMIVLTKWEAVQLADKLEVKQEMEKADWECRTKLD